MQPHIVIGSRSGIKSRAFGEACDRVDIVLTTSLEKVESLVPTQPVGLDEILAGACNRAREAQRTHAGSYGLGIENGVVRNGDQWFDIAAIVLRRPDGHEQVEWTRRLALPADAVRAAFLTGVNDTTVGAVIAQNANQKNLADDPHFILTGGKESRVDFLSEAIIALLKEAFMETKTSAPQPFGTHRIVVGRVTRDLPIREVAPGLGVAYFNIREDWELTEEAGRELARLLPADTEVLVMPEGKAISLLHVMGRLTKLPIVVCVKEKKVTMLAPVHHYSYESITTRRVQTLFLSADGIEKIRGKKVVIVDDVVSTGGTIEAVKGLLAIAGATYLCTAAVFTEDGARDEVISLGNLPLFKS